MRQDFDLDQFLPYLLNQAAELTSAAFQESYRDRGMTRTEWRVLANLGKQGSLTAGQICRITLTDKTKISRAVQRLELAGLLHRARVAGDRRQESLTLTDAGRIACHQIGKLAAGFDSGLRDTLGHAEAAALVQVLRRLIAKGQGR